MFNEHMFMFPHNDIFCFLVKNQPKQRLLWVVMHCHWASMFKVQNTVILYNFSNL